MAEKRLIDVNALTDEVEGICEDSFTFRCYQHAREFAKAVADAVKTAPTVDAVEVVRCKDCKSYCRIIGKGNRVFFGCSYMGRDINPDDFCSYGERRTDG